MEWFEKSAKNGHTGACIKLAVFYYKGDGVKINKRKARKWIDEAGGDEIEFFARQFPESERAAILEWYNE
jgi:TPR repeat protein